MRTLIKSIQGHTLVELILAMVLLAILFPPLVQWFGEMSATGAQVDRLPTAVSLGSELLEEIKSRKFDEQANKVSGNWSTLLGPDTGEATKTDFDDVDDFHGWSQTFTGPFTGYSATVTVAYVLSSDINTALTIPSPTPIAWTPSYKRIVVTVSNAALAGPVPITTIVTEVQSL